MVGQCTVNCRNIPLWISLACRRNSFLKDCVVISEFSELYEARLHTGGIIGPQEKLCKEIGGLEDWGKAYVVSIQSVRCIEGFYWELESFWAKALCNPNYFHLYDNTKIKVLAETFPRVFLCVSCVWFLILYYMCSIWSCSNWLSFYKVCCKSRSSIFL